MVASKLLMVIMITVLFGISAFAQEAIHAFIPAIFWEANMEKGVLLVTPTKMEIFDTTGVRHGMIPTTEQILNVYMSPDGKKLAYATSTGLRFVKLETKETFLVAPGFCNYFSWNSTGSSFMFAIYEKNEEAIGNAYNIKMFWADGDGKNLKQVYP